MREQFPILQREINGYPLVYLDNAATTQKPNSVIEAMNDYYSNSNANVHRSIYSLGSESTKKFETAREKTSAFIGANSEKEIIFTSGTTESINLLAQSLGNTLKPGDEILISTNKGRVIRVAVKEIRTAGRNTQGVRIIKLSGEEKVVSAIKIDDNLI